MTLLGKYAAKVEENELFPPLMSASDPEIGISYTVLIIPNT